MISYRQVPNTLTVLRLVLSGVFFLALNQYRYASDHSVDDWILIVAFVLFIAAAITDALDGYLARKWKVESTFGRIMDPVCDKVLVVGALMYLAGPRFIDPAAVADGEWFTQVSGVYPWMVVIVLLRELLVTSVRGELEGQGTQFGAKAIGKWKMILQSIVVPTVLAIVWLDPNAEGMAWSQWVRDILVYLTVLVTLISGWPYVISAVRVMKRASEVDSN